MFLLQNCRQYHDHVTIIILSLLPGISPLFEKSSGPRNIKLDWYGLRQCFFNGYSSVVPRLSFHAWCINLTARLKQKWHLSLWKYEQVLLFFIVGNGMVYNLLPRQHHCRYE